MSNMEGKKVPQVTFRTRQGDQWVDVTTSELFDNKTVVVFSLPGAFTPTCSSSHLPRYNELAPVFKKHGVDDILVVSVNDTFVMNAWKDAEEAHNVKFIPDGNGTFTDVEIHCTRFPSARINRYLHKTRLPILRESKTTFT